MVYTSGRMRNLFNTRCAQRESRAKKSVPQRRYCSALVQATRCAHFTYALYNLLSLIFGGDNVAVGGYLPN
jgi:hypothetical protein